MITALVIGTLLAVGALGFVLYPIFFGVASVSGRGMPERKRPERESAVVALREIEFDRATGKLSETDYADLKVRYTREAIAAMRVDDVALPPAGGTRPADDEIEEAVRAYREKHDTCPACGPRPEADAVYCSNCGRYLGDTCAGCGTPVTALDARYCAKCGKGLAA